MRIEKNLCNREVGVFESHMCLEVLLVLAAVSAVSAGELRFLAALVLQMPAQVTLADVPLATVATHVPLV